MIVSYMTADGDLGSRDIVKLIPKTHFFLHFMPLSNINLGWLAFSSVANPGMPPSVTYVFCLRPRNCVPFNPNTVLAIGLWLLVLGLIRERRRRKAETEEEEENRKEKSIPL